MTSSKEQILPKGRGRSAGWWLTFDLATFGLPNGNQFKLPARMQINAYIRITRTRARMFELTEAQSTVLLLVVYLWRRPVALGEREVKEKKTPMKPRVTTGPSARLSRDTPTRGRSYATFKTTYKDYRSTSDGEYKKKSTTTTNQVRMHDCFNTCWLNLIIK